MAYMPENHVLSPKAQLGFFLALPSAMGRGVSHTYVGRSPPLPQELKCSLEKVRPKPPESLVQLSSQAAY